MRSFSRITIVSICVALILSATAPVMSQGPSAGNIKAAYVDMGRVLQEDESYQKAIKDLKNYRKNLQKRIQKQRQELQKMRKKLKNQQSLLSKKQKRKRQQKIVRKMRQLQQRAKRSQALIQQKKQELLKPVLKKIDPVVKNVARERGFNAVYSFGQGSNTSVLWVSPELNITDAIIKRLDQKKSKSK